MFASLEQMQKKAERKNKERLIIYEISLALGSIASGVFVQREPNKHSHAF